MEKVLRNAAFCKRCRTEIESKYTHDFKRCPCGAIFVDGGLSYVRRGGNFDLLEDRTEVAGEGTPGPNATYEVQGAKCL